MNEEKLPAGWVRCQLDDITMSTDKIDQKQEPEREIAYIDISGIDNESNRLVKTKRYTLEEAPSRARQIVKAGDTVFSTVRPYLRNIALVPDNLDNEIASTGFSVIRGANGVEPLFLFFLATSQSFVDALTRVQYGASYPAVKDTQVKSQPVLLPPSPEQQRIVEKIETLFAELDKGEEALREVQKLLARYRQSVLKAAVTGALTADWRKDNGKPTETGKDLLARILKRRRETWQGRGKYKEPAKPDTEGLPEMPEGWSMSTTDQLAFVETGATPKKGSSEYYAGGSIPWVTSTAVNDTLIETPQDYITSLAVTETNAKVFPAGTLIVALYGEGKTRGKVSKLGIDAATNQACAGLRVGFLPPTMADYLRLFYVYNYEAIRLLSAGGVQPNLNLSIIRETLIPLPPLNEVEQIIEAVDVAMNRVSHVVIWCETELNRAASLRQSILKDTFSGKLVPQDPSDEPAEKLLERIRAAREGKPKSKRKKANA